MPYSDNSLKVYQSRYNSLCILKFVSIQIQLSLYSKVLSIQIQLSLNSQVYINTDTTLAVF